LYRHYPLARQSTWTGASLADITPVLGQAQAFDLLGKQQDQHLGSALSSDFQKFGEEYGSLFLACSTCKAGLPSVMTRAVRKCRDARELKIRSHEQIRVTMERIDYAI
jgi:hypothetical protein